MTKRRTEYHNHDTGDVTLIDHDGMWREQDERESPGILMFDALQRIHPNDRDEAMDTWEWRLEWIIDYMRAAVLNGEPTRMMEWAEWLEKMAVDKADYYRRTPKTGGYRR